MSLSPALPARLNLASSSLQLGQAAASVPSVKYEGCYVDAGNPRSMVWLGYQGDLNSIKHCAATCSAKGFPYSGSEYSGECYCDNKITATKVADSECNKPCPGDAGAICGGDFRLSIYSDPTLINVQYFQPNTTTVQYIGCQIDPLPNRVLSYAAFGPNSSMTVETCTKSCKDSGFTVAGLEYGQECWCGYTTASTPFPDTECFLHCSGNVSQICGAPSKLSVYKIITSGAGRMGVSMMERIFVGILGAFVAVSFSV
ncbi:hypothetical protein HDU97_001677 [Phlyctochytrium planicorne]|nr:hypothetical protein HDU97_001677 [Phlyctochytrium planicorne]